MAPRPHQITSWIGRGVGGWWRILVEKFDGDRNRREHARAEGQRRNCLLLTRTNCVCRICKYLSRMSMHMSGNTVLHSLRHARKSKYASSEPCSHRFCCCSFKNLKMNSWDRSWGQRMEAIAGEVYRLQNPAYRICCHLHDLFASGA